MKKIISLVLCACLVMTVLVSCKHERAGEEIRNDVLETQKEIVVESFEELMTLRAEKKSSITGIDFDMTGNIDLDVMDEKAAVTMNMQMQSDLVNKLSHNTVEMNYDGESVVTESYVDMGETPVSYIKDYDGEWYKQAISVAEGFDYEKITENILNADFDVMKYISEPEFSDDGENYVVTYDFSLRLADMLSQLGADVDIDGILADQGLDSETAAIITSVLDNLGTVNVTEKIDKKTLYTVYAGIDLTQTVSSLVDRIINAVLSAYGEGMTAESLGLSIAVNDVSFVIQNAVYNDVSITIPEEALSAEEVIEDYGEEMYEIGRAHV